MKKFIEKLHFITHDIPQHSHINQVQIACEAGAKWVQYRCLSKNDDELLLDLDQIGSICDDWGATLIVTNHIHLKGKADIQGFHMEDLTTDFVALRKQIGEEYTLGGSAHQFDELVRLANEGADYVGFGPYAYTTTKANSFSSLGLEGYTDVINRLKMANIDLPILAVGGIGLADVAPLLETGIYGIAVSSAINQAADRYEAYQDFYQSLI